MTKNPTFQHTFKKIEQRILKRCLFIHVQSSMCNRKNKWLYWIYFFYFRRDKKAFLSDQCKDIEENNTMGKTRDLFKKVTDTKGIFHAKMGTIKDRNGMDLTEAEDIKKRWQKYTE